MTFDEYIYGVAMDAWEASMRNARENVATYAAFRRSDDNAYARWVFFRDDEKTPEGFELAWPERINGERHQVANLFRTRAQKMPLLPVK